MGKVISYYLFNPADRNVKQRCEVITCDNCENCKIYLEHRQCATHTVMFGDDVVCPHSSINREHGYTRKAKSYHNWFSKRKSEYGADLEKAVKDAPDKLVIVGGDYVYLPYSFIKTYNSGVSELVNQRFIPLSSFNEDKIYEIITFEPTDLFHQVIGDYRLNVVPRFIQHMNEVMPELLTKAIKKYPDIKSIADKSIYDYIGRKAKISTLADGSELSDCHSNIWIKCGTTIECDKWKTWLPFGKTATKVTIEITNDMLYTVDNNEIVKSDTVFID